MRLTGKRFKLSDSFQQMIGGFLLAGPFVVEGGVWDIAKTMENFQAGILVLMLFTIGYSALYKADKDRKLSQELKLLGIPVRFLSLILVSVSAVVILVVLFSANIANNANLTQTIRLISVASVFSVIGAATADSVF